MEPFLKGNHRVRLSIRSSNLEAKWFKTICFKTALSKNIFAERFRGQSSSSYNGHSLDQLHRDHCKCHFRQGKTKTSACWTRATLRCCSSEAASDARVEQCGWRALSANIEQPFLTLLLFYIRTFIQLSRISSTLKAARTQLEQKVSSAVPTALCATFRVAADSALFTVRGRISSERILVCVSCFIIAPQTIRLLFAIA